MKATSEKVITTDDQGDRTSNWSEHELRPPPALHGARLSDQEPTKTFEKSPLFSLK